MPSTTPTDPAKDLIEQTKKLVLAAISATVDRDESGRAYAAGNLTDHLIDELAAKLKAVPAETLKVYWLITQKDVNNAQRERDLIALRTALSAAQRIVDKGTI